MKDLSEITDEELVMVSQLFWGFTRLRLHVHAGRSLVDSLFLQKKKISQRQMEQLGRHPVNAQKALDYLKQRGYKIETK